MSDLRLLSKAILLMKNPTPENVKEAQRLAEQADEIEGRMIGDLFDDLSSIYPQKELS